MGQVSWPPKSVFTITMSASAQERAVPNRDKYILQSHEHKQKARVISDSGSSTSSFRDPAELISEGSDTGFARRSRSASSCLSWTFCWTLKSSEMVIDSLNVDRSKLKITMLAFIDFGLRI